MSVPRFLQAALWSYDVRDLNKRRDRRYIITQVLNYGTWRQLQWLLGTYRPSTIKKELANPRRGMWRDDVLNFWLTLYNIKLSKTKRERALFSLAPSQTPLTHVQKA